MDRAIFMSSNEWKLPFNIAIGLHVAVLLCSLYLPGMFKAKPKFADIYTVSIINIAEPEQAPQAEKPPEPKQPEAAPEPVPPVVPKKAVVIEETVKQVEPKAPQAISLKPIKQKKIKQVKVVDNTARQRELDRLEKAKLAALAEEKLLAEQARLAREALEEERRLLSRTTVARTETPPRSAETRQTTGGAGSGSSNLIENQYLAAIVNRLHQYWALPENLQKNPDLTAIAVITIQRNGEIASFSFESKSGDRVFDQFVRNAIQSANPMPPIPPALKKQRFEVGLRFKPGSIR